jgi:hypothetical protein
MSLYKLIESLILLIGLTLLSGRIPSVLGCAESNRIRSRGVGRPSSWPEAGLTARTASRSAIFFRKYSTRIMMRCPFYWSLRSPVPNSIINFSRRHQMSNVNSRTTRPAFLRAVRVPTSPQSHPSKWRQRHRLPGVGCWQQALREILRGSKSSSA